MKLPFSKITTGDGSQTFYSAEYQEPYHTKSGAIEEAFKKFVEPTGVKDGFVILDYCFGLGYNTLAAISRCKGLYVYALENDADLLMKLDELVFEDVVLRQLFVSMVSQIKQQLIMGKADFEIIVNESTIRIIVGDARETIKLVPASSCDTLFWDPFSPKKCPELWEVPEFAHAYRVCKKGGMLATYSYARKVRDGLAQVGFDVTDGPIVGRRSPSTLAVKNPQTKF